MRVTTQAAESKTWFHSEKALLVVRTIERLAS